MLDVYLRFKDVLVAAHANIREGMPKARIREMVSLIFAPSWS
ncbi:hypothetical protein ABH299_07850 [Acinetobacter pittii]